MYKVQKFSKNRQFIHDLLHRAKTFHLPISQNLEIDCTDAQARLKELRKDGVPASFTAFMVKVSSKLVEENPHLNSHLFTKWTGKKIIVQFNEINCNMVMQRKSDSGEKILLPLIIKKANELTIQQIDEIIQHHKKTPLEQLPQFQGYEKIKKMPSLLMKFISFKTRSDPDFYVKYYGTYGLSTPSSFKNAVVSGSAVANTTIAFFPLNVFDKGDRQILRMGLVMDHYVLDGQEMGEAGYRLTQLIENPQKII